MAPYTYEFPRPMVTVDCIVIRSDNDKKEVLLIRRGKEPFLGCWALPGGFVDKDEDLPDAAFRELKEETGIECQTLKQFFTYGTPGRDPRGHTISVVFWALVPFNTTILPGDDAAHANWFPVNNLPPMAFDHEKILKDFFKQKIIDT